MKSGQEALRAEMKSGQEALRAEMKSGQEALRAEMKSGFEAISKRIDDSNSTMLVLFSSIMLLIVALFGYMIWDRRTMMKPFADKFQAFEHQVVNELEMNHSEGSLLMRQLKVLRKYAARNSEFADIMRSEALI
ncbi:MAG: hypothetical protein HQK66_11490 [Desulfamplus sp.]|nr:hypothetical protein [Desulfamplus sp.]